MSLAFALTLLAGPAGNALLRLRKVCDRVLQELRMELFLKIDMVLLD